MPRVSIAERLGRVLEHRHLPAVLAVAALLVSLPALKTGFLNDDFWQRARLVGPCEFTQRLSEVGLDVEGSGRLGAALSGLHTVVQPGMNLERFRSYGALPWWTYDGYKVSFWRPLSSLTHWVDYRLFPNNVAAMHAHNLIWFAGVILLVTILYRRLIAPRWIAGLAAVLYLMDDNSYFPTMWIANRNILLSLFFGILALLSYHRWCKEGSLAAGAASPLWLGCSLLSAEAGVATFAYLFAYTVALDEGKLLRRMLHLAPAFLVTAIWHIAYRALGYGASGGGFYTDPAGEPVRYSWAVAERAPFLFGDQWTTLPADIYSFLADSTRIACWAVLVCVTVLVPVVLLPLLRSSRTARFWLLGMYLAVLPVCATVPMGRVLLFAGLGAFGLVAEFVGGWLTKESWAPKSGPARIAGWILCIIFLSVQSMAVVGRIAAPWVTSQLIGRVEPTMEIGVPAGLEDQDLVVVNAPNPASFFYVPFKQAYEGKPIPRSMQVLSPGFRPIEVIRTGESSVVIRGQSGSILRYQEDTRSDFVRLYRYLSDMRGPEHPLRAEDRIELPRMTVEVISVDGEGLPVEARFKFPVSLDDRSLRWLRWDWGKHCYVTFEVPRIGGRSISAGRF